MEIILLKVLVAIFVGSGIAMTVKNFKSENYFGGFLYLAPSIYVITCVLFKLAGVKG